MDWITVGQDIISSTISGIIVVIFGGDSWMVCVCNWN